MKKIFSLALGTCLLCGCGIIGENGIEGAFGSDAEIIVSSESEEETKPVFEFNSETQDVSSADDENEEPETIEGEVGETMNTMFFDFTVNSPLLAPDIDGQTPSKDGFQFLIVDITVKNTTDSDFSMFGEDFYVYYGTGEEEYAVPRIVDAPDVFLTEDELADVYDLNAGESVDGQLIYEVPEGLDFFLLSAEDIYTDQNGEVGYGDFYDVYIDFSE